jgi:hypothetical protein
MKHILYVMLSSEPFYRKATILDALERASENQDLQYSTILTDGTPRDITSKLDRLTALVRPDAIVVSSGESIPKNLPEDRAPLGPIFELDDIFGYDNPLFFVTGERGDERGDRHGFTIGADGKFNGLGEAWELLDEANEFFQRLIGKGSPPHGHLGGRFAAGGDDQDTEAIIAAACWAFGKASKTKEAGAVLCHVIVESVIGGVEYLKTVKDLPPSQPAAGVPDGGPGSYSPTPDAGVHPKGEPDEESGMDFLILLNEFVQKARMKETWKEIVAGKLPPDETDVRQEFLYWLAREHYNLPAPEGRINETDETGYSFLYSLFRDTWNLASDGHKEARHHWLWLRLGYVDPIRYLRTAVMSNLVKTPYIVGMIRNSVSVDLNFYL